MRIYGLVILPHAGKIVHRPGQPLFDERIEADQLQSAVVANFPYGNGRPGGRAPHGYFISEILRKIIADIRVFRHKLCAAALPHIGQGAHQQASFAVHRNLPVQLPAADAVLPYQFFQLFLVPGELKIHTAMKTRRNFIPHIRLNPFYGNSAYSLWYIADGKAGLALHSPGGHARYKVPLEK